MTREPQIYTYCLAPGSTVWEWKPVTLDPATLRLEITAAGARLSAIAAAPQSLLDVRITPGTLYTAPGPISGDVVVYLNGLKYTAGQDYTIEFRTADSFTINPHPLATWWTAADLLTAVFIAGSR